MSRYSAPALLARLATAKREPFEYVADFIMLLRIFCGTASGLKLTIKQDFKKHDGPETGVAGICKPVNYASQLA